jgi:predicted RNA polymerase sigma factor
MTMAAWLVTTLSTLWNDLICALKQKTKKTKKKKQEKKTKQNQKQTKQQQQNHTPRHKGLCLVFITTTPGNKTENTVSPPSMT